MNFAPVDIVFASLILILTVRCALRGFVEEFMSMASLILGILAAVLFYKNGAEYLRTKLGADILPELLAFAGLFLIVFLLVKILEFILRDIVERVSLGTLDRLFGLLLGLVEGFLVVSVALFALSVQPLFDPSALLEESLFARFLLPLVGELGETALKTVGA